MKNLQYLSIILIFFSSCHYRDQTVAIKSEPLPIVAQFSIAKYYNKKLNLKVIDSRENKEFIGFRTPVAIWQFDEKYKEPNDGAIYQEDNQFKIATLSNNQDLAALVQKKLSEALDQRGLKQKRFTANQLQVEIVELNFIPTMYRNWVHSKLKIKASNRSEDLEKVYDKVIISHKPMALALLLGPFNPGLSESYYNQIISDCLDENLQSIINDVQLWNFLE
jgi:hypothetical protein